MSYRPSRGASGLAVVAIHVVAIVSLVGATRWRETLALATPLQVSVVREMRASSPEVPARAVEARLATPVAPAFPVPEVAIAAPAEAVAISAVSAAPAAAPVREATPAALPSPEVKPPAFDANYLENPPPAYPAISRRLNEEGRVVVRVWVSEDGRAMRVELARSSGHDRLDRSALEAVGRWRFVPARKGGQAVAASVLVPVAFVLKG
jgi:protein TonB